MHKEFDSKYGLNTQVPVSLNNLETTAPGAEYTNKYEGAAIPLIHRIIRQLRTDISRFTFIDLGSGKGRVLLVAAQYPFQSVIGVEFSKILHNIAEANISKFIDQGLMKNRPTSLNIDAGAFDFSLIGDKVIFCNNPFTDKLMLRVLDSLELSFRRTGHQVIFIYLTPIQPAVKEKLDTFQLIRQGRFLSHFGGFQRYFIYRISHL